MWFQKQREVFFDSINSSSYSDEQIKQLKRLEKEASKDSQVNNSCKFSEFSDIQNVMLSDFSLLELVYPNDDILFFNKTIGELYMDSLVNIDYKKVKYEKVQFDAYLMLKMSNKDFWNQYRHLIFGKLVRYGFSNLKLVRKISGKCGFGALLIEDIDKNKMLYFPCTNITELNDFIYDSYPIMSSLPLVSGVVNNIPNIAKRMYNSQQKQAINLVNDVVNSLGDNSKVWLFGFSLGGSLAEASYLNVYKNDFNILGGLVLFNPYHNRLNKEEINNLKKDNKLKLYVCEGDVVSAVFNYEDLSSFVKVIYIDYEKSTLELMKKIDDNQSVFNMIINNMKDNVCNELIEKCKLIKKNGSLFDYTKSIFLSSACKLIEQARGVKLNATESLKMIDNILEKVKPIFSKMGIDLDEKYDLKFLENMKYFEFLFISTHLTYTIDPYKLISFDKYGQVKKSVLHNSKKYNVSYPSFSDTMTKFLGSDPRNEVSNILEDTKSVFNLKDKKKNNKNK